MTTRKEDVLVQDYKKNLAALRIRYSEEEWSAMKEAGINGAVMFPMGYLLLRREGYYPNSICVREEQIADLSEQSLIEMVVQDSLLSYDMSYAHPERMRWKKEPSLNILDDSIDIAWMSTKESSYPFFENEVEILRAAFQWERNLLRRRVRAYIARTGVDSIRCLVTNERGDLLYSRKAKKLLKREKV